MKDFGATLRRLRRKLGLTQEELAERAGLDAATVRRSEREDKTPSLDTIEKLARGLSIKVSTIFRSCEGENTSTIELLDFIYSQTPDRIALAILTLRNLFTHLDNVNKTQTQTEESP